MKSHLKSHFHHKEKTFILFLPFRIRFLTEFTQNFYYILLPVLILAFHSEPTLIKLTVSLFFFGLTVGYFFAGPIVDYYGYRKSMLYGLVFFILGSLICIFSYDAYGLMLGRLIQGLASALLQVLSKGLISSKNDEKQSKRYAVYNSLINTVAPFSMIFASLVIDFTSWRVNFIFLLVISLFIFIYSLCMEPSSNDVIPQKNRRFVDAFKPYYSLISNKEFMLLMLGYCFADALIVPFFVSAPYIFTHVLHYSGNTLGAITGMMVPVSILGAYVSLLFIKTKYERYIIIIGLLFLTIGCFQFLLNTLFYEPSFKNVIIPLIFYQLGVDFFYAKYNMVMIKFFGAESINLNYSLTVVFAGLLCSIASALSAFLEHENFIQTAILMFLLSLMPLGLFVAFVRLHRKNLR